MARGSPCRERSLWDTGRPSRVSSLTQVQRGSAWADCQSLASRGTIDNLCEFRSTRADTGEPRGPLSEATWGPEITRRETREWGPPNEATCNLGIADRAAEAVSRSNLAARKRELSTESVLELGRNNPDKARYLSGAQKRKLMKELALQSGERVIPRCERRKRWYQVDGSLSEYVESEKDATKQINETAQLGTLEFSKIMNWIQSGEPLPDMTNIMEMAVVLEGFPYTPMSKFQGDHIEVELSKKIEVSGENIKFISNRFENGAMIFTCANEETKMWLRETAPKLCLSPHVKLEVGSADIVTHGIKLILWVKHLMKKRTTEQILDLMEKQNKGLSTREWTVVERNDFDHSASLTMWVDNRSMNALKDRKLKVHLGLGRVTFKPFLLLDKNKIDSVTFQTCENWPALKATVAKAEQVGVDQNSSKPSAPVAVAQSSVQSAETRDSENIYIKNEGNPVTGGESSKLSADVNVSQTLQKSSASSLADVNPMVITNITSPISDYRGTSRTHPTSDRQFACQTPETPRPHKSLPVVRNVSRPILPRFQTQSSEHYWKRKYLSSQKYRERDAQKPYSSKQETVDSSVPKSYGESFSERSLEPSPEKRFKPWSSKQSHDREFNLGSSQSAGRYSGPNNRVPTPYAYETAYPGMYCGPEPGVPFGGPAPKPDNKFGFRK